MAVLDSAVVLELSSSARSAAAFMGRTTRARARAHAPVGLAYVLIIEEVSMVAAAVYNMLDFRSMHGRSRTHDVSLEALIHWT